MFDGSRLLMVDPGSTILELSRDRFPQDTDESEGFFALGWASHPVEVGLWLLRSELWKEVGCFNVHLRLLLWLVIEAVLLILHCGGKSQSTKLYSRQDGILHDFMTSLVVEPSYINQQLKFAPRFGRWPAKGYMPAMASCWLLGIGTSSSNSMEISGASNQHLRSFTVGLLRNSHIPIYNTNSVRRIQSVNKYEVAATKVWQLADCQSQSHVSDLLESEWRFIYIIYTRIGMWYAYICTPATWRFDGSWSSAGRNWATSTMRDLPQTCKPERWSSSFRFWWISSKRSSAQRDDLRRSPVEAVGAPEICIARGQNSWDLPPIFWIFERFLAAEYSRNLSYPS